MTQSPIEIMENAYNNAKKQPIDSHLSALPDKCVKDLKIIIDNAATQKGVFGVVMTSIVYKIYSPPQDIRNHQDHMEKGYSGRSFDTKFITPFLKAKFCHFAMAESSWLTRSLEQPHPYDFKYPGKIRNKELKTAFLNILDFLQTENKLATIMLTVLMALLLQTTAGDKELFSHIPVKAGLTIAKIVDAVSQHIRFDYGRGVVGTARIPVLAIYSVYNLLMPDVKRYSYKTLAPLESHTSPDYRSRSLGDIEVKNADGSCFEAIEIKCGKPISDDMVGVVYRKIQSSNVDRYYILTTSEPNFTDLHAVMLKIEECKKVHTCQIIVNGVIPSLKYYLRLVSDPQVFVDEYTKWLELEYQRASGIKKEHLLVWQKLRQQVGVPVTL